ncbi:MAG: type IVB secretion system protein IcmH/DotU [Novosphingobium sp.]
MTSGDETGDGGNRTVFRPSPLSGLGGGQSQSQPQPPPPPIPVAPVAPGAPPAAPAAAPLARSPLAAAAAPPPRPKMSDEGIPAPTAAREQRAPLVSEAAPILAIAASIRSGRARIGMDTFHREASEALVAYERTIVPLYPEETARAARFLLAATVDDIAGNLPNLDGSAGWEGRSLVIERVGPGYGEAELWAQLDHALEKPEDNLDLLELAHACIATGFQGRYRGAPGGGEDLEKWIEKLFKALDHVRALSQRFVSPQWVGCNAPLEKVPTVSIIALAVAGALVLILLAYIGLRLATGQGIAPQVAVAGSGGLQVALIEAADGTASPPADASARSNDFAVAANDPLSPLTSSPRRRGSITQREHHRDGSARGDRGWIPAFAGTTREGVSASTVGRRAAVGGERSNGGSSIPAFAKMTAKGGPSIGTTQQENAA